MNEYPQLAWLRDRLAQWGINLNDASVNGVMLPNGAGIGPETNHRDTQRNEDYREAIELRFESVTNAAQARSALKQIRDDLRNGTFIQPKKG